MYQLHHIKGNTYYIDGPTNCGVYVLNDNKDVLLFDCGTSEDGIEIYETLKKANMNVTHLVLDRKSVV